MQKSITQNVPYIMRDNINNGNFAISIIHYKGFWQKDVIHYKGSYYHSTSREKHLEEQRLLRMNKWSECWHDAFATTADLFLVCHIQCSGNMQLWIQAILCRWFCTHKLCVISLCSRPYGYFLFWWILFCVAFEYSLVFPSTLLCWCVAFKNSLVFP